MKQLDLPRPHGFLLWRGKKTAVLTPGELPAGEPLEVATGDERFGVATLDAPARMLASEADRKEWFARHRVWPREREAWWPGETRFRVYPVASFEPYAEIRRAWGLKAAAEGEDCPACVQEGGGWCRLHDEVVGAGKACGDWAAFGDWRGPSEKGPLKKLMLEQEIAEERAAGEAGMPYEKFRDGDRWCVRRADTKKLMHCYEGDGAEGKADKYLAALRINAEAGEKAVDPEQFDGDWKAKPRMTECPECGKPYPVGTEECPHCGARAEAEEEKAGNIENLTKHLVKKYGGDPNFFTKCMADPDLSKTYDDEDRKAGVCARAHKIATGKWPGEHRGEQKDADEIDDLRRALKQAEDEIAQLSITLEAERTETQEVEGASPEPEAEKAGRRVKKTMLERLKEAAGILTEFLGWAQHDDGGPESETLGFFGGKESGLAIKSVGGEPWLVTWSSNAFLDRDKELFTTKGLERYVAAAEQKGDRGHFNFWHVPGTDFAEKRWQGVVGETGGILLEAGPFLDTPRGRAAKGFFTAHPDGHPDVAPEGWGCSVEYRYLQEEKSKGEYENFWVTRTSLLPRLAAANTWTKGGVTMALTTKQKEGLEAIFPDEAEAIIRGAEDQAEKLKDQGVQHKEAGDEDEKALAPDRIAAALRKLAKGTDDKSVAGKLEELASALSEDGEDEMDEEEEKQAPEYDLEELAAAMAKQFDVQLQPLQEHEKRLEAQQAEIEALKAALARYQEADKRRKDEQTPRFVLSLEKRASTAEATELKEGDPLLDMKPETTITKKSGADYFFGSK